MKPIILAGLAINAFVIFQQLIVVASAISSSDTASIQTHLSHDLSSSHYNPQMPAVLEQPSYSYANPNPNHDKLNQPPPKLQNEKSSILAMSLKVSNENDPNQRIKVIFLFVAVVRSIYSKDL